MNASRPQILYIVHRVPYPPNRGDRIRSFHILDYLSKSADVHLATLADEPVSSETMCALQKRCKNVAVEPLGKGRWLRAGKELICGRSMTEGLFRSPRLYHTVREWAKETRFDVAFLYCSSVLQYLSVPELRELPAIIDLVDVDSQKWFDYAANARGLRRCLFQLEGNRTRRLEAAACRRASFVVLVSEAEAELFRTTCPNLHTHSVCNGVDLEYFQPTASSGQPGRCIFVGALDYPPNVDAVCWFAREVWPFVRRRCPTATLAVVGRNPHADVRKLANQPGIEVIGSVPDVRPYLAEARLAVAPLRIARGVQNKVLEAMASSRAVITSQQALTGLSAEPQRHLETADTSEQWANRITHLLSDDVARRSMAAAGREYIEKHHSWSECLAQLDTLLARCIDQSSGRSNKDADSSCTAAA